MTEDEIRAWLGEEDWEATEIDMRADMERPTIEGWSWTHPDGDETFTTAGTWSDPAPIPEDLRQYVETHVTAA